MIPKTFNSDINSEPVRRVLAAHDLSCFGRCSLGVITPILAALGIQAVPLPTALLSTHTGGFDGFTFLDLTEQMEGIIAHFDALGVRFDAIYSGFLGSERQTSIIDNLIKARRGGNPPPLILIDPVLGDDGELYKTMTGQMVDGMRRLVSQADIITPNLTEACALTGTPHIAAPDDAQIRGLCERLVNLGARSVVITGIERGGQVLTAVRSNDGAFEIISLPKIPRDYPGTGDIFAATLLGYVLRGADLTESAERAARFVAEAIARSAAHGYPERNGVLLEEVIGRLYD